MYDVTRGAATRLSTSTFDIRGSLVKAFLRCLAGVTGNTRTCMQAFHSYSLVSSFLGDWLAPYVLALSYRPLPPNVLQLLHFASLIASRYSIVASYDNFNKKFFIFRI